MKYHNPESIKHGTMPVSIGICGGEIVQSYRDRIDLADDVSALQLVLEDLEASLAQAEDSPYAEEQSFREQIHDMELMLRYGEDKMGEILS